MTTKPIRFAFVLKSLALIFGSLVGLWLLVDVIDYGFDVARARRMTEAIEPIVQASKDRQDDEDHKDAFNDWISGRLSKSEYNSLDREITDRHDRRLNERPVVQWPAWRWRR